MEIKEIKILKKELENSIEKSIIKFEEKADITVVNISFGLTIHCGETEYKKVCLDTII